MKSVNSILRGLRISDKREIYSEKYLLLSLAVLQLELLAFRGKVQAVLSNESI